MSAGKTLCLKGYIDGTSYNEEVAINNKTGAANQWITIGGYEPDKRVVLKGNYTNSDSYNGISIGGSSYIRVIGMEVTRFYPGIETSNQVKDIDFINLKVHENLGIGINITSSGGPNERVRIEHSQIFNNVRKNADGSNGGGAVQMLRTRMGAFRYNKLYRNFGEGLNIGNSSNQIAIEDNFFSENKHFSFYINHASNILYHRNLTICTGERVRWMLDNFPSGVTTKGGLSHGTAILWRNEQPLDPKRTEDEGGNNAILSNVVMGCTEAFAINVTDDKKGDNNPNNDRDITVRQHSALIANNTFIDAREEIRTEETSHKDKNGEYYWKQDKAQFIGIDDREYIFEDDIYIQNNLLVAHATPAITIPQSAASKDKLHFSNNLTNRSGFTEGMTISTNIPFQAAYDHTTFLGNNRKPWEYSDAELDNLVRRAMLANNSPAINAGTADLPQEFRALYQNYYTRDYFNQARTGIPDIGAHEADGTAIPTPTTGPSPTPTDPTPTTSDPTPTDSGDLIADFNSDGKVDYRDLLMFIPKFSTTTTKFNLNGVGRVDIFDFATTLEEMLE